MDRRGMAARGCHGMVISGLFGLPALTIIGESGALSQGVVGQLGRG